MVADKEEIKMKEFNLSEKIDKWFTSECKNKCDPKGHMKVVGSEELEELKKDIKEFLRLLKNECEEDGYIYNIINKLAGSKLS